MRFPFLLLFLWFAVIPRVWGTGFSQGEQDARALGRAGAIFGDFSTSASMLFYNSAALAGKSGVRFSFGGNSLQNQYSFTGPATMDDKQYSLARKEQALLPHFALAYGINDRISVSVGYSTPFFWQIHWQEENQPWVGRLLSSGAFFKTRALQGAVAYALPWDVRIAAGVIRYHATMELEKDVYFAPRDLFGHESYQVSGRGNAFTLTMLVSPLSRVNIGISYRSSAKVDFKDGDLSYSFPDPGDPIIASEIAQQYPTTRVQTSFTLPARLSIALAYRFTPHLVFETDWVKTSWSSAEQETFQADQAVAGQKEWTEKNGFQDSYSFHWGVEYQAESFLALRAGYAWHQSTVASSYVKPSFPEGQQHHYAAGFSVWWQNIILDGALQVRIQDDRKITDSLYNFDGKYSGLTMVYSLGLRYGF